MYIYWWTLGALAYGVGAGFEALTSLFGWNAFFFKGWYTTGALLGGLPLAQGTVYLLCSEKFARTSSIVMFSAVAILTIIVIFSPLNPPPAESHRLTGDVLQWQWIRLFSPYINGYAVLFLIGGAFYSAFLYYKANGIGARMWGNACIAIGALLPGIGGTLTRTINLVEALYITELLGIIFIILGYKMIRQTKESSIHQNQLP